jgi:hypothetical protein
MWEQVKGGSFDGENESCWHDIMRQYQDDRKTLNIIIDSGRDAYPELCQVAEMYVREALERLKENMTRGVDEIKVSCPS